MVKKSRSAISSFQDHVNFFKGLNVTSTLLKVEPSYQTGVLRNFTASRKTSGQWKISKKQNNTAATKEVDFHSSNDTVSNILMTESGVVTRKRKIMTKNNGTVVMSIRSNNNFNGTLKNKITRKQKIIAKNNETITMFSKLNHTLNGTLIHERGIITQERDHFVKNDTLTMKKAKFSKSNDTESGILVRGSHVYATVSFDPNLTVTCRPTPLVQCTDPPKVRLDPHTYRISVLNRPWWMYDTYYNFTKCPYSRCAFDYGNLTAETDFVIVVGVLLNDSQVQPPKRWSHQLFVVAAWETPVHTHADFLFNESSVWNNQFNLTMSYRTDADVFVPYSTLIFSPKPQNMRPNYYEMAKTKTRMVLWFVSNCKTQSRREEYVNEMRKYIDVEILGDCSVPCRNRCLAKLAPKFRFYLAFENSLCTDYISEKIFKIFLPTVPLIPVVRGGVDYEKYLPDNTYINAANFMSAKHLALHLKDLASDFSRYSRLLEYKDLYIKSGKRIGEMGCAMCEYAHTHKVKQQVYNIKTWMGDGHCHEPDDVFSLDR